MPYQLAGQRILAATLSPGAWTAVPLTNGWTNEGTGLVTCQYRFHALTNEVEVIGAVQHASVTGTSQLATALPFTPASTQQFPVASTDTTTGEPRLQFDTTGVLKFGNLGAGTTAVQIHCWFSLDA